MLAKTITAITELGIVPGFCRSDSINCDGLFQVELGNSRIKIMDENGKEELSVIEVDDYGVFDVRSFKTSIIHALNEKYTIKDLKRLHVFKDAILQNFPEYKSSNAATAKQEILYPNPIELGDYILFPIIITGYMFVSIYFKDDSSEHFDHRQMAMQVDEDNTRAFITLLQTHIK